MSHSLILDELMHGLVATPFAFLIWKKTKSVKKILALYLLTYLVDIDHLVDYLSCYGFKFSVTEFFNAKYFQINQKAYIPFHAWEWLVILGGLVNIKGWKSFYAVILLALIPHFVYDAIRVGTIISYSIVYRTLHNFVF